MMPQGRRRLDDTKRLFICRRPQRIQPSFTSASEEGSLHHLFLDRKMVGMKFKKNIIISCETIHRNKALARFWNMKDIIEMKITTRGMQSAMTNKSISIPVPLAA